MSKLFVYGVNAHCPRDVLESEFGSCGQVDDVYNTGKGYAFVTMADQDGAEKAIAELNGREIDGQAIKVDAAKPPRERGEGGGGGGYRGGRGGGGGFRGGRGGGGGWRDGGDGGYRGGRGGGGYGGGRGGGYGGGRGGGGYGGGGGGYGGDDGYRQREDRY